MPAPTAETPFCTPSAKPGALRGRTVLITGASRGIGRALALRVAQDGANVVILAKTATDNPKLPGTIYSVAREVEAAGGHALPIPCDIRDHEAVEKAVQQAADRFGGIDAAICNASAISLGGALQTDMKRFDLMHQVNARGTYAVARAALPHLLKSPNGHVLAMSPMPAMRPDWFAAHTAYTMSKYGMSMVIMGLAAEFRGKVAFNALWPRTVISTSALQAFAGDQLQALHQQSRTTAIMADTAYAILCQPAKSWSGVFALDESVMAAQGIKDLQRYDMPTAGKSGGKLATDLYVDDEEYRRSGPPPVPPMQPALDKSARPVPLLPRPSKL